MICCGLPFHEPVGGIQPSQLTKTMNNTELNLDQLAEVSGARWADIRDHNHGKFMQTRRFNRKPNIWTSGGTTSVWTSGGVTSFKKGGKFKAIEK